MSQTSYNQDQPEAFAGMKADSGFDRVESFLAEGAIGFGLGLVAGDSEDEVRLPFANQSILSIDADLITLNSTIATVNGNSTIAVVFASDHETTMAALAVQIATLTGVLSATYSGAGRDIVILGDKVAVTSSAVTTAGATQGAWTEAVSSTGVFRGISLHQHVEKVIGTGVAEYLDHEAVSVFRQGVVWMRQETSDVGTLAVDDLVFANLVITGAEIGRVTSVSTNNLSIPTGVCRKLSVDPDGFGIAKIEVNIP